MAATVSDREPDEIASIREAVRALCAKFPGEYWRALDRERGYPTEFVAALTRAGCARTPAAEARASCQRIRSHRASG